MRLSPHRLDRLLHVRNALIDDAYRILEAKVVYISSGADQRGPKNDAEHQFRPEEDDAAGVVEDAQRKVEDGEHHEDGGQGGWGIDDAGDGREEVGVEVGGAYGVVDCEGAGSDGGLQ